MFTPESKPFLKSTLSCIKVQILIVLTVYDGIKYDKIKKLCRTTKIDNVFNF